MLRYFILAILFFNLEPLSGQGKQLKLDSLIKVAASLPKDTTKVGAYYEVAIFLYRKMENEEKRFMQYLDSGILLSEHLRHTKGVIRGSLLGGTYLRDYGNYEAGLGYLKKAEKLAIQTKDSANLFNCYISNAAIFFAQGSYHLCAEMSFKALPIAEALKDKKKLGRVYNILGNLYLDQSDCRKSVYYHSLALKYRIEIGDTLPISHSYVNLGSSYHICKEYDSSTYFYSKALQIQKIKKNAVGQAYSYDGIANNNLKQGKNKMALSYFLRAKALLGNVDVVDEQLENLIGLGKTYLKLDKKDSVLKYFTEYKNIVEKIDKMSGKQIIYEQLANYYESEGDLKEALKYNKLFYLYKDSISGSAYTKNITSLEYDRQIAQVEKIKELQEEHNRLMHEREVQKQKNIIYSFIIGSVIMVLFLMYFYRTSQEKARTNKIITAQKEEVELKNELIEEKQKEILDSIHYAKRIQTTLLAHREFINEHLKENFVLFRPKDIVSGDFYWATKKDDLFYFAVCDSTGHGVPGAFMSLLSITFLNEAINERHILPPNEVFNYVRKKLIESVSRDGQRDGFDGILICYNTTTKKITYAAANNAPVIVSSQSFEELQSDRMPVGQGIKTNPFTLYELDLKPNQSLYLFTDGYADQFGGPKGKKFMYKRLNELLVSLSLKNMSEQEAELSKMFDNWKGELEQIDDVCIIGLKV